MPRKKKTTEPVDLESLRIITGDRYLKAETLPPKKKKIWKDKWNLSDPNMLVKKSAKTMDLVSNFQGKGFWRSDTKEVSDRLWIPSKTNCSDYVLNPKNQSFGGVPMGKSWFSIEKKYPINSMEKMTSFNLSDFSLEKSLDSPKTDDVDQEEIVMIKSLKMKCSNITDSQKKMFKLHREQTCWYYNFALNVYYKENLLSKTNLKRKAKGLPPLLRKTSFEGLRKTVTKYDYVEESVGVFNSKKYGEMELILKDVVPTKNPERKGIFKPDFWPKVNGRVWRGAVKKLSMAINSAVSNYRAGNCNTPPEIMYHDKEKEDRCVYFEDGAFPVEYKNVKAHYWYRTERKGRGFKSKSVRKKISFENVLKMTKKRGFELVYKKETDSYHIHYPVEADWFPSDDVRAESHRCMLSHKEDNLVSLDPGVRKFLVGYDPEGILFTLEREHLD